MWKVGLEILGIVVSTSLLMWLTAIYGAFVLLIPLACVLLWWSVDWLRSGGRLSTILAVDAGVFLPALLLVWLSTIFGAIVLLIPIVLFCLVVILLPTGEYLDGFIPH